VREELTGRRALHGEVARAGLRGRGEGEIPKGRIVIMEGLCRRLHYQLE